MDATALRNVFGSDRLSPDVTANAGFRFADAFKPLPPPTGSYPFRLDLKDLLGADESRPGVRETVQGLLDMARGLGLANLLTDDTARRERVVAQWGTIVEETLG